MLILTNIVRQDQLLQKIYTVFVREKLCTLPNGKSNTNGLKTLIQATASCKGRLKLTSIPKGPLVLNLSNKTTHILYLYQSPSHLIYSLYF